MNATPKAFANPDYFGVVDLAIGGRSNFRRFARFSKKFFGRSAAP
jgi:hypothetical protein